MKKIRGKCSVGWCVRPFYTKGFCKAHHKRWERGLDMNDPLPLLKEKPCQVDGCKETNLTSTIRKGYCIKHYDRFLKHGDPNYDPYQIIDGMKTCEKKLHQYPADKSQCPECQTIALKEKCAKGAGTIIVCGRGHSYPGEKPSCPECMSSSQKSRRQKPGCKEQEKKWRDEHKSERAASNKKWYDSPKGQSTTKNYRQSPTTKEKRKQWREKPENRAAAREASRARNKRPDVIASKKVSRGRRTRLAARGDLTPEQWLERTMEFDGKCAYCSVFLLIDGDRYHPHYQTMDHIIPIIKSGQHTKGNVVPACLGCNISKNNKEVWDWMKEKSIIPSEKLLPILLEATKLHQTTTNL